MFSFNLLGRSYLRATRTHVLKDGVSHLLDPPIEAGKLKGEGIV
jgi:hypothetical protein